MVHDLRNRQPPIDVPIQHRLYQIDTGVAHDPRDAQFMIHDFVDAVKGIFLIDKGVE